MNNYKHDSKLQFIYFLIIYKLLITKEGTRKRGHKGMTNSPSRYHLDVTCKNITDTEMLMQLSFILK